MNLTVLGLPRISLARAVVGLRRVVMVDDPAIGRQSIFDRYCSADWLASLPAADRDWLTSSAPLPASH